MPDINDEAARKQRMARKHRRFFARRMLFISYGIVFFSAIVSAIVGRIQGFEPTNLAENPAVIAFNCDYEVYVDYRVSQGFNRSECAH